MRRASLLFTMSGLFLYLSDEAEQIPSLSFSLLQTELPVPEQFKTVWDGQKLVTTATEIAG